MELTVVELTLLDFVIVPNSPRNTNNLRLLFLELPPYMTVVLLELPILNVWIFEFYFLICIRHDLFDRQWFQDFPNVECPLRFRRIKNRHRVEHLLDLPMLLGVRHLIDSLQSVV